MGLLLELDSTMERYAVISPCEKYRYRLSRHWDPKLKSVGWIMLNPSTADALKDDNTIRRCIGFAKSWGYGSIVVTNLFAYRATNPKDMRNAKDPIGSRNDQVIIDMLRECPVVIAAWGTNGSYLKRDRAVHRLVQNAGKQLKCLATTKNNDPVHPLRQPKHLQPIRLEFEE